MMKVRSMRFILYRSYKAGPDVAQHGRPSSLHLVNTVNRAALQ